MSLSDILKELSGLSPNERRALSRKLVELEVESEDAQLCDQTARAGFALLDQMEAEDEAIAGCS